MRLENAKEKKLRKQKDKGNGQKLGSQEDWGQTHADNLTHLCMT